MVNMLDGGGSSDFHLISAATDLRLGDEILAVNGNSLQDLTHGQAVQNLRSAGPTVVLRVKPNQTLEGVQCRVYHLSRLYRACQFITNHSLCDLHEWLPWLHKNLAKCKL